MASDLARMFMRETTDTGSIAPVMTGASVISNTSASAAKRKIPTSTPKDLKKIRNRVIDGMMGRLGEDRDGAVIPADAKEVDSFSSNDLSMNMRQPEIPGQKIKNPYSGEEPLILPMASLVAPDVTPEAIHPLDPSKLPGADRGRKPEEASFGGEYPKAQPSPTLDLLVGRSPNAQEPGAATTPAMSAESALSRLPGIPSVSSIASVASGGGQAVLSANQPMPDHKPNDGGKTILEAFSRFVPRKFPGTV